MGFLSRLLCCWLSLYLATPVWVVEASLTRHGAARGSAIGFGDTRDLAAVRGPSQASDWANRLTTFNGTGATDTYDADGNRVSKTVGGVTTWYLVATVNPTGYPQVVEERTGSTPTTLDLAYTYGLDLISQRKLSTGAVEFFTTDGLGSTRLLTEQTGATGTTVTTANVFTYDAFGTLIGSNAVAQTTYLYTGEQYDPTLGMYYLRARYLRPDVGRFASLDTFEGVQTDPLSLHKYLYTQGSPVNGVDPSGEFTIGEVVSGFVTRAIIVGLRYGPAIARYTTIAKRTAIWAHIGATLAFREYAEIEATVGPFSAAISLVGREGAAAAESAAAKEANGLALTGSERVALGTAREAEVAILVNGRVYNHKFVVPIHGQSDIDVLGPLNEYIAVGGPNKARDLGNSARQLRAMLAKAKMDNVAAKAFFTKDTPEVVLRKAREILGDSNVYLF